MAIIIPRQVGTKKGNVLFQKAEAVHDLKEAKEIEASLKDTLQRYDGVGLAAPQIGISKRIFAMNIPPSEDNAKANILGFKLYVNPIILDISSETNKSYEGCLSVFYGTVYALIRRPSTVKIQYVNSRGEEKTEMIIHPLQSRIVLHESDHLDGLIFLQKISKKDFSTLYWNEQIHMIKNIKNMYSKKGRNI